MSVRVAFRADASPRIGTGHVMRCIALAEALRGRGADVVFVTRAFPSGAAAAPAGRGFEVVALPVQPAYDATWLGAAEATDAAQCRAAFAARPRFDAVVVDQYALGAAWERAVRLHTDRIVAIDDLADRVHDCDVLLDTTWLPPGTPDRYAELIPASARRLYGPEYALLRREFAHAPRDERAGPLRRLLISFGGADASGVTMRALDAVAGEPALQALDVDVVVGPANADARAVAERCAGWARVHVDTREMAALMARADLALGAGGTSSWERAWLGLPALLVTIAPNQVEIARNLEAAGAVRYLGPDVRVTASAIAHELLALLHAPAALHSMSRCALRLTATTTIGTERVADVLCAEGVSR